MPDENLLAQLLPQLTRLSNTLGRGRLYERARAGAGVALERPAMTILIILNAAGEPLRIGEIANRMQVEGPHVTRQVQALEKDGLVERVVDPADARARLIALTSRGGMWPTSTSASSSDGSARRCPTGPPPTGAT